MSALEVNHKMTILNTDLVYSDKPTHLFQYVAQRVNAGSIPRGFLAEDVAFKPVHANDVSSAVSHVLANPGHGQFLLQG